MRKIIITTAFLCAIPGFTLLGGGCAKPLVKSQVLVPAKYSEAAKLRRVAVLPFVNKKRNTGNITADIEAAIVSVRVDDKPYFSVIERTHMKRIIDEQRLGSTGLIDQGTAVRAGKIAGVEAVLLGNITQYDVNQARFYKTRQQCSRKDADGKCKSWSKIRVSCKKRTATFAFVPKLINVTTGNLVISESISRQAHSSECGNAQGPSDNNLLNTAKSAALNDFKNMIAPHYVTQTMVLLSKDDSNPPEHVNNKIEGGIKFAKAGRMDRACTLWEDAAAVHQEGYALPYLLGVCAESRGDLVSAGKHYRLADGRTISPVDEINKALLRIGTKSSEQSKLGKQLVKNSLPTAKSSRKIKQAQQLLTDFGYKPGPADGLMGRKTRDAIRKYQEDNGLDSTGDLDPTTKNALGLN